MRPISVRRLLLVLLLTAAALVAPSLPHARACSCARVDIGERLPQADGAFVGTLLSRDDPQPDGDGFSSATLVRYRYRVERAVKGDLPAGTVDVWSAWSGASCGLETPVGQRAGLLLRQDGGRWLSGLCDQADPDVLIGAGAGLPRPTGTVPPAEPGGAAGGTVVALPASSGGGGTSGRPLLAGGAGAGLLAAVAAGFIRRRLPKRL